MNFGKEITWNDIERHIAACTQCPLGQTRNLPVMGRVAAQRIISPDFKITRQHGTWTYRRNCMLTATYHPSAILRDPSKYDEVKRDFQEVVSKRSDLMR